MLPATENPRDSSPTITHLENPDPLKSLPLHVLSHHHFLVPSSIQRPSSTTSASFIRDRHRSEPIRTIRSEQNMTTYYHYERGGLVGTSTVDPAFQYLHSNQYDNTPKVEIDPVGAYLRDRALRYPEEPPMNASYTQGPVFGVYRIAQTQSFGQTNYPPSGSSHPSAETYDSQIEAGNSHSGAPSTVGSASWATGSVGGRSHPYPNPEDIRHLHTLHSLLPYLDPERKLNAVDGPKMNIVQQDTGVVLAYDVPKRLLVLFLGRKIVNKFVKTLGREDNERWRGGPTLQELRLPKYQSSKVAVRILVSWMLRACQPHTMGDMRSILIPKNTFAMCTLAQTLGLLGLHKDAYRMDIYISQRFFQRPIFARELETLWNCLEEKNRYLYAAIKVVGDRLRAYEGGREKALSEPNDMLALLQRTPLLNARVRDAALNERYLATFGTRWMESIGQPNIPNENNPHSGEARRADHGSMSDAQNRRTFHTRDDAQSRYLGQNDLGAKAPQSGADENLPWEKDQQKQVEW